MLHNKTLKHLKKCLSSLKSLYSAQRMVCDSSNDKAVLDAKLEVVNDIEKEFNLQ